MNTTESSLKRREKKTHMIERQEHLLRLKKIYADGDEVEFAKLMKERKEREERNSLALSSKVQTRVHMVVSNFPSGNERITKHQAENMLRNAILNFDIA